MNKIQFKTKKEVSDFLIKKGIDTTNWTREKWLSINKGQAEIHIMALAEAMWDSYNESKPKDLKKGEWHIPFLDKMGSLDNGELVKFAHITNKKDNLSTIQTAIKISTAMCARTSYTVVGDEKEFTYEKQIALHDKMVNSKPFHASPFENCAENQGDSKSYRNFKGWKQYRQILENQ